MVQGSQYIFSFSEAKIFDFKIGKGKIEANKAMVRICSARRTKFLNQLGVEE